MLSELPQSREAERVLVGCPILNESPDQHLSVAESLDPEDFLFDSLRDIFLATGSVVKNGQGVNLNLVVGELARTDKFASESLALQAVVDTCYGLPRFSDLQREIGVVRDHSLARKVLRLKNEVETQIIQGSTGVEALDFLEEHVAGLRTKFKADQSLMVDSDSACASLLKELEHEWINGRPEGRSTGLPALDKLLSGLQPGRLYTVAARTGMGKTWTALSLAVSVIRAGRSVLFVSLEMLPEELTLRLVSIISGLDAAIIRDVNLEADNKRLVRACLNEVKTYGLIYGRPGSKMTSGMIRNFAKRAQRKADLGLVVVDYLQLVKPEGKHHTREREVAEVSSALKNLSLELKVPVLALSQLNRAIDYQKDREPELSDLRESGAIEQDSDCVIFIHGRPEDSSAALFVKKNRSGPVGRIPISMERGTGKITYREEV